MPFDLQPELSGELLLLRPLQESDYDALFAVASDPLMWEQHPDRYRWKPEVFEPFFRQGMESGGALIATDASNGKVIGSSRYAGLDEEKSQIEIGWTFLACSHWGGVYNGEMKRLMLGHAFKFVENVIFMIGKDNMRSRKAVEKIGGAFVGPVLDSMGRDSVVYRIQRTDWS